MMMGFMNPFASFFVACFCFLEGDVLFEDYFMILTFIIIYFPFLIFGQSHFVQLLVCGCPEMHFSFLFDASRNVTGIPLPDSCDYVDGLPFLFIFLV